MKYVKTADEAFDFVCEYNYSVVYGKVDAEILSDYETLKTYYEVY